MNELRQLWTKQGVRAFLAGHKINTAGARTPYVVSVSMESDGDEWVELGFPYWSQNNSVVRGVLKAALDAAEKPATTIFLANSIVRILCYTHTCDPD